MNYRIFLDNVSFVYRNKYKGGGIRPPLYDVFYSSKYWWERLTTIPEIREFCALEGVTAKFSPGEIIGIVGRNGSGKSTLCKLLSKNLSPSSGQIHLGGRISHLIDYRQNITRYHSGKKYIHKILTNFNIDRLMQNEKINEIAEYSGLENWLDEPVGLYSVGMLVRLHLSVALNVEPDILVLDEIFSIRVGDDFRSKLLQKIKDLKDRGTTIFLVSHDVGILKQLCNKFIFLEKGICEYVGDMSDLDDKIDQLPESIKQYLGAMKPTITKKLKVFICHSSDDKAIATQLYYKLDNKVEPWIDSEKILPGQNWQSEISLAIQSSDVVIICLSKNSINKKGYVQKEIKYALDLADEQPENTIFLIPIRLEECIVPDRLKHVQWLDYFKNDGDRKLIKSLSLRANSLGIDI